jgi:hypothetical protein
MKARAVHDGTASPQGFSVRYTAAMVRGDGPCPIETGTLGRLADHECRHGRLPGDRTAPCGCWRQEGAAVLALPTRRAEAPGNECAA